MVDAQLADTFADWLHVDRQTIRQSGQPRGDQGLGPLVPQAAFPLGEGLGLFQLDRG